MVLSLSVALKQGLRVLDVKNAFVSAPLKGTIYMIQPNGFLCTEKQNWVYFEKTALYGLRQASREWHLTLQRFLLDYGFKQSKADPTQYVWVRDLNGV